jgi:tetratricopeptide (TPR) repeat protein
MSTRFMAIVAMVCVLLAGGCFSHSQDKKAAAARWEKMSSRMKLPVAQQQFNDGKYADAAKTIGECLRADPNMPQAHLLAGKIILIQGQPSQGIAELKRAVELDEKLDDGWFWLGFAFEQQKQAAQACEYYQKALNLNGSNVEYILAVARASVALGKADEALALLKEKIGILSTNIELKVACADVLCSKQKYDEAIALYRQAVLLDSERDDVAESFGYCCILGEKWTDAVEVFTKLSTGCTDDSKKSTYLQLLGMCQANAGQYSSAMASYGKLSPKDRDNPQVWLRMGQAALGAGNADRAYACSMRALSLQPDYSDAIAVKGSAEYLKENYDEAIKSFSQIVGDPANKAFAWMMLARCYEHTGDNEKAQQAAEKARTLSDRADASETLARRDQ